MLWHKRSCHVNFDYLIKTSKVSAVNGLPNFKKEKLNCENCKLAKSKRISFKPIGRIRRTKPLQLLHMYVCGPLPVESRGGAKYFLSITDDFSRMVICFPLKEKSQVLEYFKTFQANAERVSNRKIISVHCDNGTPKQLRTKLDLRAKHGIRLGYARSTRGYRNWLLEEQKLIETCNVHFDESKRLANGIFNFTNLNNKTKNWTEFRANEPLTSYDYDGDSTVSNRLEKTTISDDLDKSVPDTSSSILKPCVVQFLFTETLLSVKMRVIP
ncbi:retrovirus-related Pol polyprotein from transposon TNT 1-94 [Caerostris extrusa]|uniref:Retrovirus-related Pol polyprotein from transposon TNT 1-94 n=1 Tax=Caerostris extrusa TaxID=172846 RepID=A0AAV4TXR7_CAEEX|nr:retrovirus-related Pol polyprotein from transposon TNT 1-94 [Caerostris extrusa]